MSLKKISLVLLLIFCAEKHYAQKDSSKSKIPAICINEDLPDSNLVFTGTKITEKEGDYAAGGKITMSGYVSTYYAHYTDTSGKEGFQKFPTVAPRNDQFGLNIAEVSFKYSGNTFRGIFTTHYGDIPVSAWSQTYNYIQEAHIGVKLAKKLWFDAGFFRTHIGLESIQPRENMTVSLATVTYYEPYFLSGAKLTYQISDKLTVQLNAFNGYNTFIETNKNKAFGFSTVYEPTKNLSLTFNTITSDETPDYISKKHQRVYNNLYGVYRSQKLTIGAEVNYGIGQHYGLVDTNATASMFSALLAVKYSIRSKFSIYGRGEYFSDDNEMLTGPIEGDAHKYVGLNVAGATLGLEFKFIVNSYLRIENRFLETLRSDEKIFLLDNKSSNYRNESIVCFGIWF